MANRHKKRCSISLIIAEMHIKATMRYEFTPVRMAILNEKRDNKYWQRCREKGTHLVHVLWEYKLVQTLQKIVEALQNLKKISIIIYSSNFTYGYITKGKKNHNLEGVSALPY